MLANMYVLNDGPLPFSPARAGVLYLKAVNKGYLRAAPSLTVLSISHPEFGGESAALKMVRSAAEAGDGHAQHLLDRFSPVASSASPGMPPRVKSG